MVSFPMLNYAFLLFLSSANLATSNPSHPLAKEVENQELAPRALANGATLRILCLGASITYGYESSTSDGYRYGLRGALVNGGNKVNMIGSLTHGTMNNNQVEGWCGYRIAEVAQKAELSLPSKPNVVLINAGTNDMAQNYEVATAHLRMGTLVDRIFEVLPNTVVIVSTLLPNANALTESNVQIYNKNLIGMVATRAASGKKIALVDMSSDWFSVADLKADGTHPTDEGYLKMAKVFYNGIEGLSAQISAPLNVAGVNDLAAQNDAGAGTALDAICQNVSGESSAQKVQCGIDVASTSTVVPNATPLIQVQTSPMASSSVSTKPPTSSNVVANAVSSVLTTTTAPLPTTTSSSVRQTSVYSSVSNSAAQAPTSPSGTSSTPSSSKSVSSATQAPTLPSKTSSSPLSTKSVSSAASRSSSSSSLLLSLFASSVSASLLLVQASVPASTNTPLPSSSIPSQSSSTTTSTTLFLVSSSKQLPSSSSATPALSGSTSLSSSTKQTSTLISVAPTPSLLAPVVLEASTIASLNTTLSSILHSSTASTSKTSSSVSLVATTTLSSQKSSTLVSTSSTSHSSTATTSKTSSLVSSATTNSQKSSTLVSTSSTLHSSTTPASKTSSTVHSTTTSSQKSSTPVSTSNAASNVNKLLPSLYLSFAIIVAHAMGRLI